MSVIALVLLGAAALDVETRQPTPTIREPSPAPSTPGPDVLPDPAPEPPEPEPAGFQLPPRDFGELPPPHSSDPAWVTVQQSTLYKARFPVQEGCPPPARVEDMEELRQYATAQLGCLQEAWKPVLRELALPTHDVPHLFFGDSVTSPCGTSSAPAYYCSADGGAIYFGERLLEGTAYDPLWAKDLVGHEYGHHLQAVNGFFDAMYDLPGGSEVTRRSEIQATCLAFGMIRKDRSYSLDEQFFNELEPHLRSFLDDDIHGSKESLAYWGMRGFYADRAAHCNTWVVGSEWVE